MSPNNNPSNVVPLPVPEPDPDAPAATEPVSGDAGEVLGEKAGDLADGGTSTFREIAVFILESLRSGAMWAGWSEGGVPAFGDDGDVVPDDVTVEHLPEELAILAGVMALDTIQKATAAERGRAPVARGMNRAQRREAARRSRRRV